MCNYFMAVDHVFKILDPNCWNSFLPPKIQDILLI